MHYASSYLSKIKVTVLALAVVFVCELVLLTCLFLLVNLSP